MLNHIFGLGNNSLIFVRMGIKQPIYFKMTSKEIESNVKHIFENFTKEEFIYDLLTAYGTSKTSVTRLKKGDFNLSKIDGEILYKKKVFFKEGVTNQLLNSIETLSKEERIIKHSPRFTIGK